MKDVVVELSITDDELKNINTRMKRIMKVEIEKSNNMYIIPKELFTNDKKVDDEIRYVIDIEDGKLSIEHKAKIIKNDEILNEYKEYEKIIIITESPHRDEFTFDYKPIGVAQGKTGYGIEQKIEDLICDLNITGGKYILIISNPVQFQASLGSFYFGRIKDSIRNNLWAKLYNKNEYLKRLQYYKAEYIINATTSGRRNRIKKVVDKYKEVNADVVIMNAQHPSKWVNCLIKYVE